MNTTTNNSNIFTFQDKELIVDYGYNNEECSTLSFEVKIEGFSGHSVFYIFNQNITSSIKTLETMYKELKGTYILYDLESDGYIKIEINKLGHIFISGQLVGKHNDQSLKFRFRIYDNTLLNLVNILKEASLHINNKK